MAQHAQTRVQARAHLYRPPSTLWRHREAIGVTTLRVLAIAIALAAVLWAAPGIRVEPVVHRVALFGHLAALLLGFGSVLAVDWTGLLWLLRRRTIGDVLLVAGSLHGAIWTGYAGLLVTGAVLGPNIAVPETAAKLALVLVIGWNGVLAGAVQSLLERPGAMSRQALLVAGLSTTVSQACWWGAIVIGFANAAQP